MSYQQHPGSWQDPSWSAANQPPSAPAAAFPPGYDGHAHTNTLAVASLATSLFGLLLCGFPALIGAIMGHLARKQIRQRVAHIRSFLEVHRPADTTAGEHELVERALVRLGNRRNGVALAGIIVGWTGFVLWLAFWVPVAWGFIDAATA
jgi:hypothetical protein